MVGRSPLVDLGIQISQARQEATTGLRADLGRAVGGVGVGRSLRLHEQQDQLTAARDANSLTKTRLDATQSALESLTSDANKFVQQLVSSRSATNGGELLQAQAQGFLSSVIQSLNTSVGGVYVFGGVATDQPPMRSSQAPPPAASARMEADFVAQFGMASNDPNVQSISAASVQSFLDTQVTAAFAPGVWASDWSDASSTPVNLRINLNETATLDMTANSDGVRQLAKALSVVATLAKAPLNAAAFQTLVDTATKETQSAIQLMTRQQASLGGVQQRVSDANDRLGAAVDLMTTHLASIENVDPYEASTRLSTLTTQLETTYAVTARLSKLSLINYL